MKTTELTMPEITVSYKNNVKASERKIITNPQDAYCCLKPFYAGCMEHHEEVYAIFLNKGERALGVSQIAKGGIDCSVVDVKIILQIALKVNATGIILSHNHPTGIVRPSNNDINLTNLLKKACQYLEITLRDHIILTKDTYYSFANEGFI